MIKVPVYIDDIKGLIIRELSLMALYMQKK